MSESGAPSAGASAPAVACKAWGGRWRRLASGRYSCIAVRLEELQNDYR